VGTEPPLPTGHNRMQSEVFSLEAAVIDCQNVFLDSFKPAVVLPTRGPEAEMKLCRTLKV
jgi:hypothetical protein